jgi:uncharacterized protein (TIGR00730 family)
MKKICVYCGSSPGVDPVFMDAAQDLGRYLAENGLELIYGGSNRSLMGAVANTVLAWRGKVTAVMPRFLHEQVGHTNAADLILVETMLERKQKMLELSDAYIALPGGFGTLDEIFEVLDLRMLDVHNKPSIFFNVDGFFDDLLTFLDQACEKRFFDQKIRSLAMSATNIEDLFAQLKSQKNGEKVFKLRTRH